MTTLILGTMDLIVKTTGAIMAGGVFVTGASGAALYRTKPDEKSLENFIKGTIQREIPIQSFFGRLFGYGTVQSSTIMIEDCIVARYADVTYANGTKRYYIGALGRWFDITKRNDVMYRNDVTNQIIISNN